MFGLKEKDEIGFDGPHHMKAVSVGLTARDLECSMLE